MSKKYDQRATIKLDPDNDKKLRELSKSISFRPSMAKLANALIRDFAHTLETNNK